eukprot:6213024-Pleurochrysis_carterae.AAC.11
MQVSDGAQVLWLQCWSVDGCVLGPPFAPRLCIGLCPPPAALFLQATCLYYRLLGGPLLSWPAFALVD